MMIIIMKEYIVNWSFSVSLRFGYFLEYTWNIIFGYIFYNIKICNKYVFLIYDFPQ